MATVTLTAADRLKRRQAYLHSLWTDLHTMLDTLTDPTRPTGGPDDQELIDTWGPLDGSRDRPYSKPYDGAETPAHYAEPLTIVGNIGRAVQAALEADRATRPVAPERTSDGKPCPSKWGRDVIDQIRALGIDGTPQSRLTDCGLAKAIWADWQLLTGPNRLARIHAKWTGKATGTEGGISKWGREQVSEIRELPGFNTCQASTLDDAALAKAIWVIWQGLSGPNRLLGVYKQLMKTPKS
jgi:hypothetical protein